MKLFDIKNIQFEQILQDIKSYLNDTFGQTINLGQSSVFGQLITVISAVAHNIMVYIEDALVEQNKYTAQRKKSIMALAAQSGYQPSLGRAAGVWVKLAHKPNNLLMDQASTDVIIQDKTRILCTQNSSYYCLDLNRPAVVINRSTNLETTYFYAVQGAYETQRFISSGGKLYNQNIKYIGFIDVDYLSVYINGVKWERKDSLYDMQANEESYFIRYSMSDGLDLTFGNDVHGKSLNGGDVIEIRYLLHDGEGGNIEPNGDMYFVFASDLQDVNGSNLDGNAIFEITIASRDSVSSGSDAEHAEVLRNMIGFNSRALVLSDPNSYKAFLNRFSFVGYNRTWSEPGSLVVKSLVLKNYQQLVAEGASYFDLTDEDYSLTPLQKESIKNAIITSGSQLAGVTYDIIDMELCKYAMFVYVKLKDADADHTTVSTKIRNVVAAFFCDVQSDQYIPKSDIITVIKNGVGEVDGVNVYFLSEANETAKKTGEYTTKEYTWNPSTGTYKITEHTTKLFAGQDPNIGLDSHGNILIRSDHQFPVLMGGWEWKTNDSTLVQTQPITIVYE